MKSEALLLVAWLAMIALAGIVLGCGKDNPTAPYRCTEMTAYGEVASPCPSPEPTPCPHPRHKGCKCR